MLKMRPMDRMLRNHLQFSIGCLLLLVGVSYLVMGEELQGYFLLADPIPIISCLVGFLMVLWAGIAFGE